MAGFEHKGVSIELNERVGEFSAKVAGKLRWFPSVAAAKKAIDKAVTFEPFAALRRRFYEDPKGVDWVPVQIIGVVKATGRGSRNSSRWADDEGRQYEEVFADTPANRVALEYQRAVSKRHVEEDDRQRSERIAADEAIVRLKPTAA